MITHNYKTPYGIYFIQDTELPYTEFKSVDNTPVPSGSLLHEGGFVIGVDMKELFVVPTFNEAKSLLKDILLKSHRYKLDI